ncbi:DMT family transporter [Serpentinicella alkaliphila]|uniref:Drug/metabolite transporter (DMT)-like permease n=1 Tax=Serpentinicella alkaliphila TaxID=1734049 RepID=A0A4R2TJ99_9FIRM|nr:DMT family transporter [Serpentinicella alkaliphila]QUH24720.1 DMT family transporter [Serpentinicella alkaliphila]TCQ03710.1 drug/metabolite transporter (DMT)-like permease [Serpentinicella alkaliphila]
MTKQLKANLSLLFITIIWGSSFILTKNSLNHLPTYNFLAIRFIISSFISIIIFRKKLISVDAPTIKYGILTGLVLFAGYAFQTVGLNYTTASKSGFITGFSVVIVPVFSAFLLKSKPTKPAIIGVIFAIIGLGFLTLDSNISLNIGDLYTLICALAFALHIISISKFTVKCDSINLAVIQIFVVGILSLLFSFVLEKPTIPTGINIWINIVILAVLATTIAFLIQTTMQKYTTATHTALILSAEPVFSAFFAFLIAGEMLPSGGILGSALILSGMLISELDWNNILHYLKNRELFISIANNLKNQAITTKSGR